MRAVGERALFFVSEERRMVCPVCISNAASALAAVLAGIGLFGGNEKRVMRMRGPPVERRTKQKIRTRTPTETIPLATRPHARVPVRVTPPRRVPRRRM